LIYRRDFGLDLWKTHLDGAATWAYQDAQGGHIWNDFSSSGTLTFTYPTVNGVIDTIAWEGYREGVDDVRYVNTLERFISHGNASANSATRALAAEAQNYLDTLDVQNGDLNAIRTTVIGYCQSLAASMKAVCGALNLNNWISSSGVTVQVQLRQNGSTVSTDATTLDAGGNFIVFFVDAAPGTYDVWVKASHWLARLYRNVVISSSNSVQVGTLLVYNGDCDGDNELTSTDLAIILAAMDSYRGDGNYAAEADLNGDGVVDTADLSILLPMMDWKGQ
jgi:hypothetical protein